MYVCTMELQWGGHPRGGVDRSYQQGMNKKKAHPESASLVGPSAVAAATAGAEAGVRYSVSTKKRTDDLRTYVSKKGAPPPVNTYVQ